MILFSKITSKPITRKEYSYESKGIVLNFTLRQDQQNEMCYFKELLKVALLDIEKDIKNTKK